MKHWYQRLLAAFCATCLLFSACGQPSGTEVSLENDDSQGAMGRYLEEDRTLPENVGMNRVLVPGPEGSLELLACTSTDMMVGTWNLYRSEDGGRSWTQEDAPWLKQLEGETLVYGYGVREDGTRQLRYITYPQEYLDALMAMDDNAYAEGTMPEEPPYYDWTIAPDGTPSEPREVTDSYMGATSAITFAEDGSWFLMDYVQVYHYGSDGKLINSTPIETSSSNNSCVPVGDRLYVGTSDGVSEYDIATGEKLSNEALDSLRKKPGEMASMVFSYQSNSAHVAASADGKSLCFADPDGIYQMKQGGSVVEKLLDGSLTSLNMPSLTLEAFVPVGEEEFVLLLSDGKNSSLMGYTYSPDTPTVPQTKLEVFGLEENKTVRQAMSLFQRQHPDVQVKYTVASAAEGTTTSDQLRTLSTQLLSGQGPDILLLDGMPIDSYMEKGVLMDLSEILAQCEPLLENVSAAFQDESGIWAVPARFSVPYIMAPQEAAEQINTLNGLVKAVQEGEASGKYPTGAFVNQDPLALFNILSYTSAGAWIEDGKVQEEALTQFLEAIAAMQKLAASPEEQEYYSNALQDGSWGAIDWAYGKTMFHTGLIQSWKDLATMEAASKQRGDGTVQPMEGQMGATFCPQTIVGINNNSKQKELAGQFVQLLLSQEVQKNNFSDGLAVNKQAFTETSWNPYSEFDDGYSLGSSDDQGNALILTVKWPDQATMDAFAAQITAITTPCVPEQTVQDLIWEAAQPYFTGGIDCATAVEAVQRKLQLVLAE